MRRLLLASCLAVATLSGCAGVSINESAGIERVLAAPSRSAADRERDAREKPAEVLALAKFRRGATVAAAEGLAQFPEFGIELLRIDIGEAFDLAQRYQLSAYDAAYLWLAADLKCPLATFDERLAAAALAHLSGLD